MEYAKKGFSYSALKVWNETLISMRELPTLYQFGICSIYVSIKSGIKSISSCI